MNLYILGVLLTGNEAKLFSNWLSKLTAQLKLKSEVLDCRLGRDGYNS